MRVITGSAKGHKLKSVKGLHTRPTLNQVKEAVFNVLGPLVTDKVFLDLFAGTGAMGIEALSRGAGFAYFNDYYKPACQIIKENLVACRLLEQASISNLEATQFIKSMVAKQEVMFDLVYLDPPYEQGLVAPILKSLGDSGLLKRDSWIIVESSNRLVLDNPTDKLELARKMKYGDTTIGYYRTR